MSKENTCISCPWDLILLLLFKEITQLFLYFRVVLNYAFFFFFCSYVCIVLVLVHTACGMLLSHQLKAKRLQKISSKKNAG